MTSPPSPLLRRLSSPDDPGAGPMITPEQENSSRNHLSRSSGSRSQKGRDRTRQAGLDDRHEGAESEEALEGGVDASDDDQWEDEGRGHVEEEIEIEGEDRVTRYLLLLVGLASISGLMFGIDTAIISGTLVVIGKDLSNHTLSNREKELITSITTIGALLGGLSSGSLSDLVGRKPVLGLGNIVFILGALLQCISSTVSLMVLGRFVVGVGVGLASCLVPVYIGELSPTKLRGRLVTVNVLCITAGQVIAYMIGAAFQHVPSGWRWMVGLSAVPAAGQMLGLAWLPESPRFLLRRRRPDLAYKVLSRIYALAPPAAVQLKLDALTANTDRSIQVMESSTFLKRLKRLFTVGSNRRAVIVGAGLQAFQQLCGFNSLMYFSSTLFASLGFRNSTAVSSLIAIVNFIFTLVSLVIVDPWGRRTTMLRTTPIMVLALFTSSSFFHQLTLHTGGRLDPHATYDRGTTIAIVSSLLVYCAGYAAGLGSIPWQQGEAFRLEMRGLGSSVCTAVNWLCNAIISATFLSLMDAASPAGAFALYGLVCVCGWVFCYLCQPETANLSLEEVCDLFSEDFGVQKSLAIRGARLDSSHKISRQGYEPVSLA